MIKDSLRSILNVLHLDLTKNLEYDRLTKVIIKTYLNKQSNCIDIGCHKGEIMDFFVRYAPKGNHVGFEPIPPFFEKLISKYSSSSVTIYPYALSDKEGKSKFQYVKNAPAYSGIKKRKYDIKNPDIQEIKVELKRLDDIIDKQTKVDFIKIDVEGAELQVLGGSSRILSDNKPIILFEFGLGASDFYGTQSIDIFTILTRDQNRQIYTLKGFIKDGNSLSADEFEELYKTNREYYFVAH